MIPLLLGIIGAVVCVIMLAWSGRSWRRSQTNGCCASAVAGW